MKHYHWGLILLSLILIISMGCSSSGKSTPIAPNQDLNPTTENQKDGHAIMTSGTFEIDPENKIIRDVTDRVNAMHYNITAFLGGYFKYYIQNVNGQIWTIRLEIENPTDLQVHDVRIIYVNMYGKEVVNYDGFTNLFDPPGGNPINPFHYFAKEYPNQAFPVGLGAKDDEILVMNWPAGAQSFVTYVIECSLGGNAQEPIKISDIQQMGNITPAGGGKIVTCVINDWQNDVSGATILANAFNTTSLPMYRYRNTNTFMGNLVNLNGVAPGTYSVWIQANSPNPGSIGLWMPFSVTVVDTLNNAPKFNYVPYSAPDTVSIGMITALNGAATDYEQGINYNWEQVSPVAPLGTYSGTQGPTSPSAIWKAPQVAVDTQYLLTIRASENGGSNISRAVVAVKNEAPLPPEITYGPMVAPNPVNEGNLAQFGVRAIDPNRPGENVQFG
ncbi:hypothetical protein KKB99_05515, partial [bacterium]|nr:hypothetical protein [bacterium]MBU1025454.1 hypothetical protein [bacterium]